MMNYFLSFGKPDVTADAVKRLLYAGANSNARTPHAGNTPPMLAAKYAHPQAVRVLLEHGANRDAKDHDDNTAFELAYREKKRERNNIGFTHPWDRYRQNYHEVLRLLSLPKEAFSANLT